MPLTLFHKDSVDMEALHTAHPTKTGDNSVRSSSRRNQEESKKDESLIVLLESEMMEDVGDGPAGGSTTGNETFSTANDVLELEANQQPQHRSNKDYSQAQQVIVPSELIYSLNSRGGAAELEHAEDDHKSAFSAEDELLSVDSTATPPQRVLDYEMPSDSYSKKGYRGRKGPLHEMVTKKKKKHDFIQSFVANLPWNNNERQRQAEGQTRQSSQNERNKDEEEWQGIIVPEMAHSHSGSRNDHKNTKLSYHPPSNNHPHARKKGILKTAQHTSRGRRRIHSDDDDSSSILSLSTTTSSCVSRDSQGRPRRKLFPSVAWYAEVPLSSQKKVVKNVAFAPKARLYRASADQEQEEWDNEDIWWQPSDFEEFRKVGDLISSELEEGNGNVNIWLGDKPEPTEDNCDPDQWWSAFGHSIRGLEHMVCVEEGEKRLEQVENSISVVLQEQEIQRHENQNQPSGESSSLASTQYDAEQIRSVSMAATGKAREAARNRGANDSMQASMEEALDTWEYQQWKRYRQQRKMLRREQREQEKQVMMAAAFVLQRALRNFVVSIKLERRQNAAAASIQAAQRQRAALRKYSSKQAAILSLQSCARGVLAARQFRLAQLERMRSSAAKSIQSAFRSHYAQKSYALQSAAIISIQSFGRIVVATKVVNRIRMENVAAIRLQAWIRMLLARWHFFMSQLPLDLELDHAALTLSTPCSTVSPTSSSDECVRKGAVVDPILLNLERNLAVQRLHPEDLVLVPVHEEENENGRDDSLHEELTDCTEESTAKDIDIEAPHPTQRSLKETSGTRFLYAVSVFAVVAAALSLAVNKRYISNDLVRLVFGRQSSVVETEATSVHPDSEHSNSIRNQSVCLKSAEEGSNPFDSLFETAYPGAAAEIASFGVLDGVSPGEGSSVSFEVDEDEEGDYILPFRSAEEKPSDRQDQIDTTFDEQQHTDDQSPVCEKVVSFIEEILRYESYLRDFSTATQQQHQSNAPQSGKPWAFFVRLLGKLKRAFLGRLIKKVQAISASLDQPEGRGRRLQSHEAKERLDGRGLEESDATE